MRNTFVLIEYIIFMFRYRYLSCCLLLIIVGCLYKGTRILIFALLKIVVFPSDRLISPVPLQPNFSQPRELGKYFLN